MAGQVGTELRGPRLAWVTRKLNGTVTRKHHRPPPSKKQLEEDPTLDPKMQVLEVVEPAGYLVMFPTGNSARLSEEEVKRRGFDKDPPILNVEAAKDPEKSAAARFLLARSEAARRAAYKEMEDEVTKACLRRVGSIEAAIANYDPKGKVEQDGARAA